jgi:hypothetical protein
MTVRIQIIKTYDIDVAENCEDPIGYVYSLQTTTIHEVGKLIDAISDNAEIVADEKIGAS